MTPHDDGSWDEWSKHVLLELKRHTDSLDALRETMQDINTEIAILKLKAGVWGTVAGLVAAITVLLLGWLNGGGHVK